MGKKTVWLHLRLEEDVRATLEALARRRRVKLSQLVRRFIYAGLDVDGLDDGLSRLGSTLLLLDGIDDFYKGDVAAIDKGTLGALRSRVAEAKEAFAAWHPYSR